MEHTHNQITQDAEAGGLKATGCSELQRKTLSQNIGAGEMA